MFGCAPEACQEEMAEYHAFSERVGVEAALRPLDEAYVRHLVAVYLDQGHTEPTGEIEPSTEEALSAILQRAQGNVRQVLAACSWTLDAALDGGRSVVTPELVGSVVGGGR